MKKTSEELAKEQISALRLYASLEPGLLGEMCKMILESALMDSEKFVLVCRIRNNTLEQVSEMLGVTRERIRQLEARGMRKLKVWTRDNRGRGALGWVSGYIENALRREGIYTIEQAQFLGYEKVRKIKGIGNKGLKEMARLGLIKLPEGWEAKQY